MSFWDDLRASAGAGIIGLTDTVSSGIRLAADDKIRQEIARSGGQTRTESVVHEESPAPPNGPFRAAQLQAEGGPVLPLHYLMIGGGLLAIFMIARSSR